MATPNYGYEKRQRELAKKKKKEDKARAKAAGKPYDDGQEEVIENPMAPPPADASPEDPAGG